MTLVSKNQPTAALGNDKDPSDSNHYGSKDSLVSVGIKESHGKTSSSIRTRRNVKSLPMLDCSGRIVGPVSPRPERRSEPSNKVSGKPEITINVPSSSQDPSVQTPSSVKPELNSKHKMLIDLNKDLGSIFHTSAASTPVVQLGGIPTKTRTPTTPRPVSRRSNLEDTPELSVPSRPVSRRSNLGIEDPLDIMHISRPPSNRSFYEEPVEPPPPPPPAVTRIHRPHGRGLYKSLSRSSIYEDYNIDELEVYHTISGGRSNLIAASRAPIPFAKITRRPARLVAGIPFMVDEDVKGGGGRDFDTESMFSLGEDTWRVSEIQGYSAGIVSSLT